MPAWDTASLCQPGMRHWQVVNGKHWNSSWITLVGNGLLKAVFYFTMNGKAIVGISRWFVIYAVQQVVEG